MIEWIVPVPPELVDPLWREIKCLPLDENEQPVFEDNTGVL